MKLTLIVASLVMFLLSVSVRAAAPDVSEADLDRQFTGTVRPFLDTYCMRCHSGEKPKAQFDVKPYSSLAIVQKDQGHWAVMREKLVAKAMPPEEATAQPSAEARKQIIDWIDAVRRNEAKKHAGDPGEVLARRLSNSEYDYTIRDLIGVDLKPTREYPIDPANTGGFDNSGESLTMSPSLLNKYLKTAREIATHMYLKQSGFAFAKRPMLSETDRDKFCELQIVNFYHAHSTDYADYFESAWRYKHRAALGKPDAKLADMAATSYVSAKYLATVWGLLEEAKDDVGPVAKIQAMWKALPTPTGNQPKLGRPGAEQMREYVIQLRAKVEPRFGAAGRGGGGYAMSMWVNQQYAANRMTFDKAQLQDEGAAPPPAPEEAPPTTAPAGRGRGARGGRGGVAGAITNVRGDQDLLVPAGQREKYEASFAKFCAVFPDRFYTQQRGTNYFNEGNETGRYLSAGFLNRMGYNRDDTPYYQLVLTEAEQKQLDSYWLDMDYIASVTRRTFVQSFDAGSGQARALLGEGVNAAPDEALSSEPIIKKYADGLTANANEVTYKIVQDFFKGVNDTIRWSEKARIEAEPSHLAALQDFAERAYRRPLTQAEKDGVLAFYKDGREKDKLDHEAAVRDTIVYVLMSPDLAYRVDMVEGAAGVHPLSDYDLASRLSYFLWASMPDAELLSHAKAGDLHDPKVIAAQARRMLKDPKVIGLATEFGGNWLGFRRFEDVNTVNRERFPAFTDELREAMYQEPIRFLVNVFQNNRSILDFVYADDTFVNPVLAKHYGMPDLNVGPNDWVRVEDANKYERGGLLGMAAFMTKNSPGLRTSPVKRGNWVVRNMLGEVISPPPAAVPELPQDEAKTDLPLRDTLARHRADPSCAACHSRFDAMGLVFEGFGPVGERRQKDLAGRAIDASATFPSGSEGTGFEGLRKYIKAERENDLIDNVCSKLLIYAVGRSLIPSDELLIEGMHNKLAANGYRFDTMVESIVTSPQFLTKRGRGALVER